MKQTKPTPRRSELEAKILRLLANRLPNHQIADQLSLTFRSIKYRSGKSTQ